jgi:hypothetical protein
MSAEISNMAENQAFVLVVHIIIVNGVSLYSRISGEQFRQHIKEKLMEVPIFLVCVKNVLLVINMCEECIVGHF